MPGEPTTKLHHAKSAHKRWYEPGVRCKSPKTAIGIVTSVRFSECSSAKATAHAIASDIAGKAQVTVRDGGASSGSRAKNGSARDIASATIGAAASPKRAMLRAAPSIISARSAKIKTSPQRRVLRVPAYAASSKSGSAPYANDVSPMSVTFHSTM